MRLCVLDVVSVRFWKCHVWDLMSKFATGTFTQNLIQKNVNLVFFSLKSEVTQLNMTQIEIFLINRRYSAIRHVKMSLKHKPSKLSLLKKSCVNVKSGSGVIR